VDAIVEGPNFEFSTETREVRACDERTVVGKTGWMTGGAGESTIAPAERHSVLERRLAAPLLFVCVGGDKADCAGSAHICKLDDGDGDDYVSVSHGSLVTIPTPNSGAVVRQAEAVGEWRPLGDRDCGQSAP
jgi:hypothetical protein